MYEAKRNCIHAVFLGLLLSVTASAFAQEPEPFGLEPSRQAMLQPDQAVSQDRPKPETPPEPVVQQPKEQVKPAQTASTPSTIRIIFANFRGDQKDIWTSPFHINRGNAKWWAAFGLGTAALIATDRTTERSIPFSVSQTAYSRDVSQIGEEYVTLPLAGALYLYGRKYNAPKAREVGVLSAEALLDSEIVVTVLKIAGGRERPNVPGGNGRFLQGKGLNSGFPSGHAIETWTFASVIAHEYGPSRIAPIVAYGLAAAVSVARFTGQYHYPSDIVAGGAMGWFIGRYVWDHHLDPNIHKRYGVSRLIPKRIGPMVQPGSRTYGLSLGWQ